MPAMLADQPPSSSPRGRLAARLARRRVALALTVCGLLCLLAIAPLAIARSDHGAERATNAQAVSATKAANAAGAIDALLFELQGVADGLAADLDSGAITPEAARAELRKVMEAHPQIWGLGITYDTRLATAPDDPNKYLTRPGGEIRDGGIGYDYTNAEDPRSHWWQHAYEVGKAWVPPYLGGTTGKMVALYTTSFAGPDAAEGAPPAGVIILSLQLDTLNREVGWSDLGSSGYGFIVSQSGSYPAHPSKGRNGGYVSHPAKEYWRGAKAPNVFDVAARTGNTGLAKAFDISNFAANGVTDYKDEITGQDAWLVYQEIPTSHWKLGFVVIKEVVLAGDAVDFHYLLGIGLSVILALALFAAALTVLLLRGPTRQWTLAGVLTLAPALGIALILIVVSDRPSEPAVDIDGTSLLGAVTRYEDYVSSVAVGLKPETVLAGVFIQGIEPSSNGNWNVTGTIWQRYQNGVSPGVEPGFLFADAQSPPDFAPAYDVQDGSSRTVGWTFSATIRPRFELSRYPLDEAWLTLRVVHRELDQPIVLVPDVGEYDLIVPPARPGIADSVAVSGFTLRDSYFGYRTENLNSTFGIPNFSRQLGAPELTFTARFQRGFVSPFLSQMLPLIVVSVLLFAVHLMMTRHSERQHAWGATTTSTVGAVGGLLFVSILSHNGLRTALNATEIIYLEYAYFIIYGALLAVALNSILFAANAGGRVITWQDNQLPKLAYWPAITLSMFIVTLAVFF